MTGEQRATDEMTVIAVPLAVLLTVVWLVAFFAVWIGSWSLKPHSFDSASSWRLHFALPRAAWSLLLGLPAGLAAGLIVRRHLRRALT